VKLPFYFDYACPWAYLGSARVEPYFQDLGVEIDFRPVRLADLAEAKGEKGLPPGERKRSWYVSDLLAWAEMVGAEFSQTASGPTRGCCSRPRSSRGAAASFATSTSPHTGPAGPRGERWTSRRRCWRCCVAQASMPTPSQRPAATPWCSDSTPTPAPRSTVECSGCPPELVRHFIEKAGPPA
jgi:hypothetical protein